MTTTQPRTILLTGATGYVGGRLLRRLQGKALKLRCLARRPDYLQQRVGPSVEVVQADLLDRDSLLPALQGVDAAYYLVHSMGARGGDFEESDRLAARNFGWAAKRSGLSRIIYLGGLGEECGDLSPHLRSRHEVGEILRRSGIETIELRASIVIGSGSLSFEMVRDLVEKLPVMITPRWVEVQAQPIAIRDLVQYLEESLEIESAGSRIFEIGGRDKVSYRGLMREYARQRGLRRWMIRVPVLTPRLSSLWLGLVTPLYARVGRLLIDSIRHPTVVQDRSAEGLFSVKPKGMGQAIAEALANEDEGFAATRWSDALSSSGESPKWGGVRFGKRLVDSRTVDVPVPPRKAFAPIQRLGGAAGWHYAGWLWRLRGLIDLMAGGAGMRRGRRHPVELRVGDVLDFWRVERLEQDRRLLLRAEMKLPGRAWLEFEVSERDGGATIRQTAVFDPVGLPGLAYWYGIFPLHVLVFRGMLRGIARSCRGMVEGESHAKPQRTQSEVRKGQGEASRSGGAALF